MTKKKYISILLFVCFSLLLMSNLTAQYDQEKAFAFLKETFDRHDKNLHKLLIRELNHYINTFPQGDHVVEAQYLLAKVYQEKGDKPAALATYLKMIFLYPDDTSKAEWTDVVRGIVADDKKFKNQKSKILDVLDKELRGASEQDRYFDYLALLKELDVPKLNERFVQYCRDFIEHYPGDGRIDQVLIWIADSYTNQGKNKEAEVIYLKLNSLFPESQFLPQAIYKRGVLLYNNLKKYDQAIAELNRVAAEFPESEFAAEAMFVLGTIKEKKKKDYKGAVSEYRKLVENYPQSSKATEALFTIAKINKDKLKDYPAAISVYNEIVVKDTVGIYGSKALEEMATIYKRNLKDYGKAAETYKSISEKYPNYVKAADRLYDAALLCEKKLSDYPLAISYYQMIVEKYPTHKKAKEAKKRIKRLQQKLEKMSQDNK